MEDDKNNHPHSHSHAAPSVLQVSLLRLSLFNGLLIAATLISGCLSQSQSLSNRPSTVSTTAIKKASPAATGSAAAPTVTRPSGAVFPRGDFCSCLKGLADSLNKCSSFCQFKNDTTATLYLNTDVGPEISLNKSLQTMSGWCTKEIGDGLVNPNCQLDAFDGQNHFLVDVKTNGNSLTANVDVLSFNTTYVMTLVENGSGSGARSKSFQFRRIDSTLTPTPASPLMIAPVNMYSCITRGGTLPPNAQATDNAFDTAFKLYFYYSVGNEPPPVPPNSPNIFCHDIQKNGKNDSPLSQRTELRMQIMNIWNSKDIRFFDLDKNGTIDINDAIKKDLLAETGQTIGDIFAIQEWPAFPAVSSSSSGSSGSSSGTSVTGVATLGFIMTPWFDQNTNRAFCLKQEHYEDKKTPVYQIVQRYVGVPTEAIYMAIQQDQELTEDAKGNTVPAPIRRILIREGLLKKIWFYRDDQNQIQIPTEEEADRESIYFFWPPRFDANENILGDPRIYNSNQFTFKIVHPSQDSSGESNGKLRTSTVPPDNRFGCVPSRDNK